MSSPDRYASADMVKRTSLNLDLDLVAQARKVLGTNGTTDTVHRALEDVIREERLRRLADWTFEHLTPADEEELERWSGAEARSH
jgi:Arc/MetJ family transcription regulator